MRFIVSIFFFFPVWISAQDITGVWTGYIKTPGSQLEYELAISGGDKKLSGYSLIIYPKDGIENIGIKTAKIKQGKKEIYFEDGELVYDNFIINPIRMKMFGKLSLVLKDTLMILQGNFSTRSIDFRDTRTYSGEVYLQKTARPLSSKMLITMDEINLVYNFSFIAKKTKQVKQPTNNNPKKETTGVVVKSPLKLTERKIQKISEIFFSSDSLQLSFYDNGTVDGDTISMVLNGKMIAEKIKLTTNAYRITIPAKINQNDSLVLVMHAESLGLIPPNTGLLIIQDGATRHEIRFEGDLQKSSAIVLKRKR
ncbi:MAG TPA: hypothetical protein VGQ04_21465 [Chitinophagaceae bacterium]|jgi:hypothetical protein|nr:hypothetical protein [Chitinophagaceae bacterium]